MQSTLSTLLWPSPEPRLLGQPANPLGQGSHSSELNTHPLAAEPLPTETQPQDEKLKAPPGRVWEMHFQFSGV